MCLHLCGVWVGGCEWVRACVSVCVRVGGWVVCVYISGSLVASFPGSPLARNYCMTFELAHECKFKSHAIIIG